MTHPFRRTSGVMVREIEGEVLVLDTEADKIHQLNITASYIWNRCDGSTPINEIAEALAKDFDIGHDEATKDVIDTVAALKKQNLIVEPQESPEHQVTT